MDAARTRRLAERISKIVAELLERRIKDPRLGFVTVTEVRLTADWREAKVFYTVFGTPEEQADTAAALASATATHMMVIDQSRSAPPRSSAFQPACNNAARRISRIR